MVERKTTQEKFQRVQITIEPALLNSVKNKLKIENKNLSGAISTLLKGWIDGSSTDIHRYTPEGDSQYTPVCIDGIQEVSKKVDKILLMLSEKQQEPVKQVKPTLIHTNTHQSETPIHTDIERSYQTKEQEQEGDLSGMIATKEAVFMIVGHKIPTDSSEYDKISMKIKRFVKKENIEGIMKGRDKYYPREKILPFIQEKSE
jgi:hypothetical protein